MDHDQGVDVITPILFVTRRWLEVVIHDRIVYIRSTAATGALNLTCTTKNVAITAATIIFMINVSVTIYSKNFLRKFVCEIPRINNCAVTLVWQAVVSSRCFIYRAAARINSANSWWPTDTFWGEESAPVWACHMLAANQSVCRSSNLLMLMPRWQWYTLVVQKWSLLEITLTFALAR